MHVQYSTNHPKCDTCDRRFANKNSLRNVSSVFKYPSSLLSKSTPLALRILLSPQLLCCMREKLPHRGWPACGTYLNYILSLRLAYILNSTSNTLQSTATIVMTIATTSSSTTRRRVGRTSLVRRLSLRRTTHPRTPRTRKIPTTGRTMMRRILRKSARSTSSRTNIAPPSQPVHLRQRQLSPSLPPQMLVALAQRKPRRATRHGREYSSLALSASRHRRRRALRSAATYSAPRKSLSTRFLLMHLHRSPDVFAPRCRARKCARSAETFPYLSSCARCTSPLLPEYPYGHR